MLCDTPMASGSLLAEKKGSCTALQIRDFQDLVPAVFVFRNKLQKHLRLEFVLIEILLETI